MSKKLFYYGSTSSYTARTLAFLAATGISDTTIANALNTFDLGLISNSLDTKVKQFCPVVGGTATTHKSNFMNPADTDAAFRLTFAGGITHSATGMLFNGSTGFANTHLIPSVDLSSNNQYYGVYIRTNNAWMSGFDVAIGGRDGSNRASFIQPKRSDGFASLALNNGLANNIFYANADARGYFSGTRRGANDCETYKSGVSKGTDVTASGFTASTVKNYIGAANLNGTANVFVNQEICTVIQGLALTTAEDLILYNLIQAFNTALSRQI